MTSREKWRPIEEWPYEVSDHGRVRRADTGHVLALDEAGGYLRVNLYDAPRHEKVLVHHLVAIAFVGLAPGSVGRGPDDWQVNHRNGRKTDNRPSNLEWVTHLENHRHASRHGLKAHGIAHPNARLDAGMVLEIRELLDDGRTHRSIAKRFGVSKTSISNIAAGRTWAHVKDEAA